MTPKPAKSLKARLSCVPIFSEKPFGNCEFNAQGYRERRANVFQDLAAELSVEFHAQLRIAGHFQDVEDNLHAIYLDDR